MRFEVKWIYGLISILFIMAWMAGTAPAQETGEEAAIEDQEEAAIEDQIVGNPKAGEKLVETLDCRQCHVIQGDGGEVGPDLTNLGLRRSKEWLVRWLEDPTLFRPSSGMPGFSWKSEQEIHDIIAYLDTFKQPVDKEKILKEKNLIKAGEKLVKAYDCRACHKIGTGGIDIYPDLTHIGRKLRPEWDKKFLKNPADWDPFTYMPNFNLSDREINAIVAYLMSPKKHP